MTVTILAGGSGTRFWPLSTEERPKQFLSLFGPRTMLQQTFDRLKGLVPPEKILVLTNDRFVTLVQREVPELPPQNVIGEPISRDTAAAVTLGAAISHHRFGGQVMLALPADHVIRPVDAFQQSVRSAAAGAGSGRRLYTFGVPPTFAATGYGYLESGHFIECLEGVEHVQLLRFKEKPNHETARSYLHHGGFYWNSGMFAWSTQTILDQIKSHLPDHARRLFPMAGYDNTRAWQDRLREALLPLPKISIDFGVMEKAQEIYMIKAPFDWNDVGSWSALEEYLLTDGHGNAVKGDFYGLDAANNLVYCESESETVALVGVKDLVVVRAGQQTLVVHRERLEDIKRLVQMMQPARTK